MFEEESGDEENLDDHPFDCTGCHHCLYSRHSDEKAASDLAERKRRDADLKNQANRERDRASRKGQDSDRKHQAAWDRSSRNH